MLQIWDGKLSLEVAKDIHMTAPCFRKRVHRYNEYGIAVLLILGIAIEKLLLTGAERNSNWGLAEATFWMCFSKSNRTMPLQKSENSYVWHSKTYWRQGTF